jgi:hypothetical protein
MQEKAASRESRAANYLSGWDGGGPGGGAGGFFLGAETPKLMRKKPKPLRRVSIKLMSAFSVRASGAMRDELRWWPARC